MPERPRRRLPLYILSSLAAIECGLVLLLLGVARPIAVFSAAGPGSPPPPREDEAFYSVARTDRSGAALHDMILALAHGYATNATYGGACYASPRRFDAARRQADKDALIVALGLQHVLRFACPPPPGSGGGDPLLAGPNGPVVPAETYTKNASALLTPAFLAWLRAQSDAARSRRPGGLLPGGGEPLAVVHVRRGDVDPCSKYYRNRYLPNSYYVEAVERYVPSGVPVVVYSEAASFENFTDFERLTRRPTNDGPAGAGEGGTTSRTVTVRLDADVTEVWEAIGAASHVVLSWSSFSYVPALLNGRNATTVVFPPKWREAVPRGWTKAGDDLRKRSERRRRELAAERCHNYVPARAKGPSVRSNATRPRE